MRDNKTLSSGFEFIKNSENNIILFGFIGTGKTTLLNKICGQNFEAKHSEISVTREVQYSYSLRHNNIILDFPGLNSSVDVVAHLKAQKNALNVIPIRMICFVVRYTPRYDDIIKSVSQMLMIFREYRKNICIIITNSENSTTKSKSEIEMIFNKKFVIDKILFSTLETAGIDLCEKLEGFKRQMKPLEQIIIKSSDLTQHIDPKFDLDVMEDREKYINEFKNSFKIFNEEFRKATEGDLKRALYFSLRDYKDNLIKKYTEIIKRKKADLDDIITEVIMFNNAIFNDYNEFKKKVELELDIEAKNINGKFNRYKRCPNCGKIWFLDVGCPYIMCGERSTIKDKIFGRYKNYFVSFIDGKLNKTRREEGDENKGGEKGFENLTEEEKKKNLNRTNGQAEIKPEGWGAELKWDEIEDVTYFVLKELKTIQDSHQTPIINMLGDPKLLIEYGKYEEALTALFEEKTKDEKKILEKKKLLEEILSKKPDLSQKAKELSKQYEFELI